MMETKIEHYNITTYLNSTPKIVGFTAVLYFLFATLSKLLFNGQINLIPFFPTMGFAAAFTIIFGRKALLGVAIGSLLFSLNLYKEESLNEITLETVPNSFLIYLIRPLIAVINAFLVSYLTQLWCKTKYPFNNGVHILYFALACLLGSIIAPAIGVSFLTNSTVLSFEDLQLVCSNFIRGNTLGIIFFTPFVLSWLYKTENNAQFHLLKKAEAIIILIIALFASIYVFTTLAHNESILYLILLWAAYRFDIRLISTVTLIIAGISMYYTDHRIGSFVYDGWNDNFIVLQLFLFVNMVSILFFKAILMEKEVEENKLKISEQVLSTERNILKATIESTNTNSVFSLDTNLNYLNFNSLHEKFMKEIHGASIKIGDNHLDLISFENKKEEFFSIFRSVLNGNNYEKEEKDPTGFFWKIAKTPIRDNTEKIIGISVIITNISDLKLKEIQLKNNNYCLNERVKELRCLYDITKIVSDKTLSKPEKLQACVRIIPASLQFTEKANSRIQFRNEEFFSENYKKNDVEISQKIIINGKECGCIEMGYSDIKKMNDNDVFLEEEIKLLETLSDIISKSMQTRMAEEKLRKSEENYRILFENVQDVFFKTSIITKKILDVSPSCSTFNGITREELIGQDMSIIYSDKDKMEAMFHKIRTELKVVDYSNEITIKGKSFHISVNAKIVFDSNGEPEFAIGSIRNITKRKLAEENLKISEEKFRTIYENMQDVYYLHTLDGTLLDISPSVEKHFKEKRENLIGMHIPAFYCIPAKYEELKSKIQKKGYINDQEIEFLTPSGETLFFSLNSKLIKDSKGNLTLVEGTMRNINERILNQKQLFEATEKIKESEAKFRAIYESFDDVYFKKTLDGLLLDVSPSVEKYFNMKRETVIGMNAYDFYVNRTEGERFYEAVLQNKQVHDYEERFLTGNGEIIYFSVSAKVINDSNGQPAYFEGTMRDITERIQNRVKLQEGADKIKKSEEKFRSIFENMQDIYYLHNFDGKITEISPSCEKHFKYKREEMIGLYTGDLYYDPSKQDELREKIIKYGYINDEQVQFVTATGEPIFFSINCKIIYDQNGSPSHVEGSMRNINERILNQKQLLDASEKIKESEAKFRSIYENMQDVYYSHELDGKILDMSPSVEKHFKYSPEDVKSLFVKDFYADLNVYEKQKRIMIKNGSLNDEEAEFVTADGELVYFSFNSKIIYDPNGEPIRVEGTMRNMNERIINQKKLLQATEKTKESEAKFRSIYENFEDVYFKTKLDGTIQELSPSFEKHFLRSSSEAIGGSVLDLYYDEKDRDLLLEKLKINNHISDFDAQFKDANGDVQFVSINAHYLYEEGIPTYIEGTLRNVNDRIAVQKEMLAKNRKLEFQNTELEQFAYIASHDLQEPLITVIHSIQMLEEELGKNLNEEQKHYLEFINSSTSRMQLLVKGLLDYSRIGKERKSTQIDCNKIIADVLADMDSSLKESNAIIEYENLPIIEGNATEMRQLFQNLISNANKFRKKNILPKIKIAAVKEENNWLFSIEDNGIGIEEHDMDKVFIIFKRLHNRHEYQGTGIGLSHCKKIVEQHRGKIWVESKFNEGSTFKWTFPIEQN